MAFAFYGFALTAWLGIAAAPLPRFPLWEALPLGLAVVGTGFLVWGLIVLRTDISRARRASREDASLQRQEIEASVARSKADIATHEYWRSVATMYGDDHRTREIDATLQALQSELAHAERDLR